MKRTLVSFIAIIFSLALYAQINAEQFALDVSKAEAANTEKLKDFIWKRYSSATVDGEEKATLITEFKFDENGALKYGTFSSGISHGTKTIIHLPGKNAVINAENKYYSQLI